MAGEDSWIEREDCILRIHESFHFRPTHFQLWDAHRILCRKCLEGKNCRRGKKLQKKFKKSLMKSGDNYA